MVNRVAESGKQILRRVLFGAIAFLGLIWSSAALTICFPDEIGSGHALASDEKASYLLMKGKMLEERGKYIAAIKMYRKALLVESSNAETLQRIGDCYRKQRKYEQAIVAYEEALDLEPEFTSAHHHLGATYADVGSFGLAEHHLRILRELGAVQAPSLAEHIDRAKNGR